MPGLKDILDNTGRITFGLGVGQKGGWFRPFLFAATSSSPRGFMTAVKCYMFSKLADHSA